MNGKLVRYEPSPAGFGRHLWVGRVRFGSTGTMTPMWPHIRRSSDEFCNDVLAMHLYPLVAIDIWWRRHLRDGLCERCLAEEAA